MRRLIISLTIALLVLSAAAASALTVEETQLAIDLAGASWTAGDNEAARLHRELGWYTVTWEAPPELTGEESLYLPQYDPAKLPATLDWRDIDNVNWVTPVRNQYQCGSCWAFATVGPIESHIAIAEEWPDPVVDLSEQQMLSCDDSVGNMGCNGGFTTTSFKYAQETGLFDEECLTYHADDTWPCSDRCADWQDRLFKIDDWQIIGKWGGLGATAQDIMDALQNGPVGTSLVIYDDFMYYTGGIYETVVGIPQGMHAVTIVGYNANEEYWICKNSWGDDWGEAGFFRIKWGAAFIGLYTILPHYTSQGLGPWPDDDTTDDDAADDDATDDDNDDDSDLNPDCSSVCEKLAACDLLDDIGMADADECNTNCSAMDTGVYQCLISAISCTQTRSCIGASSGGDDDDDDSSGGCS